MVLPPGFGAGEESRTLDLNLGKVALYQLSYSRMITAYSRVLPELQVISAKTRIIANISN